MKWVKLTNLGNLAADRFLDLNKYGLNLELKLDKLSKLWGSKTDLESYISLFKQYTLITIDKDEFYFSKPSESIKVKVSSELVNSIHNYERLGLMTFEDITEDNLSSLNQSMKQNQQNNPLRNLKHGIIELTGVCNLSCKHCYRGGSRPSEVGLESKLIINSLEPMIRSGVKQFTFTGGEPTLRRKELFEILDYLSEHLELRGISPQARAKQIYGTENPTRDLVLNSAEITKIRETLLSQLSLSKSEVDSKKFPIWNEHSDADVTQLISRYVDSELFKLSKSMFTGNLDRVVIMTNGFFNDTSEFVQKVKSYGNVEIQTSLDAFSAEKHDAHRGKIGVFDSVKRLVDICYAEGVSTHVCGLDLNKDGIKSEEDVREYFNQRSDLKVLGLDITNLGNAVRGEYSATNPIKYPIGSLSSKSLPRQGWCTGFIAPQDIHIKPTGVIGNCKFLYGTQNELGNITEQDMTFILNNVQNSLVYNMFKDGRIEKYQHELDTNLFPHEYNSSCELMTLTIAYALEKERLLAGGVLDPIKHANLIVAQTYSFKK